MNDVQAIRDLLQQDPVGEQAQNTLQAMEDASAVALESDIPADAVELGTELLKWWIKAGIGFVPRIASNLLNRWMGREAIEAAVAEVGNGWEVLDCECGRCVGYAIKNLEQYARRNAPQETMVVVVIEEVLDPRMPLGLLELMALSSPPPQVMSPRRSSLLDTLRRRGPFGGM